MPQKVKPYISDLIDNIIISGESKILLKMKINFTLSKDSDDKRLMYSKNVFCNEISLMLDEK